MMSDFVVVIGGGPAGLMAAEVLLAHGVDVALYEAKPSPGRKLLIAGKGGLNLTHSEPRQDFLSRYGDRRPQIEPMLDVFGPAELRAWAHGLGFETFVGTSGRVFPEEMRSGPLLHAWLEKLRAGGLQIFTRHRWLGWNGAGDLVFETRQGEKTVQADAVVLGLGGASRPEFGSDGAWVPLLAERGVEIVPFRPANCGFDVDWTPFFRDKFEGEPVKAIAITFGGEQHLGEFVITQTGVEGSLIYALSAQLRDEIEQAGRAVMLLDLTPEWDLAEVVQKLSRRRGSHSFAKYLKRTVNISGVKSALLWEFVPKEDFADPERLAAAIKALPVPLVRPRPLAEAISSAGGVRFESLDERLMLRNVPGVFCAGEMLDWEAPTGGYLLTASFSSGYAAGLGVAAWLGDKEIGVQ